MSGPEASVRDMTGIKTALGLLRQLMTGAVLDAGRAARTVPLQEPALRRHLAALEECVPEVVGEGRPRRYRFHWPADQATGLPTVVALAVARAALAALRGSELDARLAELVADHLRRAPATGTGAPDLARMFFARTRLIQAPGLEADGVDRIAACLVEQRRLQARYRHFDGQQDALVLEPLTLVPSDEGLYLYARCVEGPRVEHVDTRRLYNLARMRNIRATAERFAYPSAEEHDPRHLFRHCFGIFLPDDEAAEPETVVLRFAPAWQGYLDAHQLHETQEPPVRYGDGRIEARMHLFVTYDLVRWIRGFGHEVEVVAPAPLRRWVQSGLGARHRPETLPEQEVAPGDAGRTRRVGRH